MPKLIQKKTRTQKKRTDLATLPAAPIEFAGQWVACMRKILVTLNEMVRTQKTWIDRLVKPLATAVATGG